MKISTNTIAGLGVALLGALALGGATLLGLGDGDPTPPAAPPTTAPASIADGKWFGFVSIDREGERVVLSFDEAEMLTGDVARQAAVAAGVIAPGEGLPNDFFIANPDDTTVELRVADGAEFFVISGMDVGVEIVTDIDGFESLSTGSYGGPPIYGIAPGIPTAMDVDVSGGELVEAHAVYLP